MKKLKMLIISIFLIWTVSFAQNTQDTTKKKKIELPENVAKEAVKDIIKGDSCNAELQIIKQNLEFEKTISNTKDKIISNLNEQIGTYKEKENNWNSIISLKDQSIVLERETSKKLSKDLKIIKRKKTFIEITGFAALLGLTYLAITK